MTSLRPVLEVTRATLEAMTMEELDAVVDGLTAARDAAIGILNQPRTEGRAQEFLDVLADEVDAAISLAVEIAENATPTDTKEAHARAFIVLKFHAWAKDGLPQFIEIAAAFAGKAGA